MWEARRDEARPLRLDSALTVGAALSSSPTATRLYRMMFYGARGNRGFGGVYTFAGVLPSPYLTFTRVDASGAWSTLSVTKPIFDVFYCREPPVYRQLGPTEAG